MFSTITDVTDATFATDVLQSALPVVVNFWAQWCGPCLQFAPILHEVAVELAGQVKVVRLDVESNPATTAAAGVVSIPTINVYQNGQVHKSIVGARPKRAFLAELQQFLR